MSVYTNPTREHDPYVHRLIHLLLLAEKHGKVDTWACMQAVAQGRADYLEVRG